MRPTNLLELQDGNLRALLHLLRAEEGLTRQDLVERTGLSPSGVSKLVSTLIQKGLVVEDLIVSRKRGRRAISLKLNEHSIFAIGVRLARNYIKCGLFNILGTVLTSKRKPLPTGSLAEVTQVLGDLVREAFAEAERIGANVVGIGVSAPGPLFTYEGRMVLTSNNPEWKGFSIKGFLATEFSVPVYVEHDANVSALAECWFGKGTGAESLIYIVVDRGVGAGIYTNGQLFRGHLHVAGEIGHTTIDYNGPKCECGNRGCLEMYTSSYALHEEAKRVVREFTPANWPSNVTIDDVFRLAREGDRLARQLVERSGMFLGIGIANLINTYNPERIILGDEMTRGGDIWFQSVLSAVRERTLEEIYSKTDIQMSSLEVEPAFLGTGTLVIESAFHTVSSLGAAPSA